MALRDEIIWRSGIVYIVLILVAAAILARVIIIQFVEGKEWAEMGEGYIYKTDMVPANRGDILASDGRILASSVPQGDYPHRLGLIHLNNGKLTLPEQGKRETGII